MTEIEANYESGQSFDVHFVWRIPDGDFLRAIFQAKVLKLDAESGKYLLLLEEFLAGRQEDAQGKMRPLGDHASEYWAQVASLAGRRISLAYEADDGRPLWLRFETLTGEHNFFSRLNEIPPQLAEILAERAADWQKKESDRE
ncbi:MAG: hypothetical protein PVH18_05600 [Chloroflexota bacterium]|jgi:hypothetical protein